MTLNMDNIAFSSFNQPFQNYESALGTISVPSTSYTIGTYKTYSTNVALDTDDSIAHVLQNFSFDSSKWWVGYFVQVEPDANFSAQTRIDVTGTVMTITVYVINQAAGTVSNPAFTLNVEVRRFLGPFA